MADNTLGWGIIRAYAGWHITPAKTETIELDVAHTSTLLFMPTTNVLTVESVEVRRACGEWYLLPSKDWSYSKRGILELANRWFERGFKTVRVTMVHGYNIEDVAFLDALATQITARANAVLGAGGQVKKQSVNGASVEYFQNGSAGDSAFSLTEGERDALSRFVPQGYIRG